MDVQILDTMTRYGEPTLLFPDKIYRSSRYFLIKLSQADGAAPPVCNPATPGMERGSITNP